MTESEYENLQEKIRQLKIEPEMQAIENKYPERDYEVNLEFPEFTCLCPKTGKPDFAIINIDYIPDKLILESKSLKLYLNAYRNIGIFGENVVNKILDDLVETCKPRNATVEAIFNSRGGISISVRAEYNAG